jgi:predicted peroxiredoxin
MAKKKIVKKKVVLPSTIDLMGASYIEKYFNEKINEFIKYIKDEVKSVKIAVDESNVEFRKMILQTILEGDRSVGYEEDYFWTDFDIIESKLKKKKFITEPLDDDDDEFD